MPLSADWLPVSTPLDPAEDPPNSVDPLGTLLPAERLAEILLPGFTVRMWRCRLLTIATVAAAVAERAVALMNNRDDPRLDARLAFERLFVSAVVRLAERDPQFANAPRGLPGRDLAKTALLSGEPLTSANFLKGQAVNGPFGVIARLARQLELIDDEGQMGRNAVPLLIAWSDDEKLSGVLDEDVAATRTGAKWMSDTAKRTVKCIGHPEWPGPNHSIWDQLAVHIRPDKIGCRERRFLRQILFSSPVRRRMGELLTKRVDIYRQAWSTDGNRGRVERAVLIRGIRPELADNPIDRLIGAAIGAADAYEQTAGLLQQTFDGLVWGLKRRGGRARPEAVVDDARLRRHLEKTRIELQKIVPILDRTALTLGNQPSVSPPLVVEPLRQVREDAARASASLKSLTDTVLRRHERVHREKRKAPWIECESHWTLMPGEHRVDGDSPPVWKNTYLHPFKIPNAYSLLGDLGDVALENLNVES
jgi:hypothetical protein